MVLKPTLYCDRCGQPAEWDTIHVPTTRSTIPNNKGPHYQEEVVVTDPVDLCWKCAHMLLREMVGKMEPEEAKKWLAWAKEQPKPQRV